MADQLVRIHILPGGILPRRQTAGAIGYDVHVRAIVSPHDMDLVHTNLRRTVFDFATMPRDLTIASQIVDLPDEQGQRELVYRLSPGESTLVGIGFVTEMDFPMFYWIAPRSGLSSKYNVMITNAPGTVDPDYRGEAGVLVFNRGPGHFDIRRGMRIAQIVFQQAIIPDVEIVERYDALSPTTRHTNGFGSTGLK